ncbi:zinc ribbon domain-containing protein [Rubinisphaera margarita]|uniref:zinc ribbon domain-containing protein n=1 Tax=Rubinisphaera margarita TaxID=2909586 RepID=UPI001EE7E127|nr:zinc ribbon domain-containing protein [Rubinisphaera margarita]MCG6154324.1 zinc ribbon domain-containing protein [Rubinisphaera margarita]
MDLRMCPSCKQSVLDDEAQVCPFCGAAMDGSSGPSKAPAKPAAKKQEKKEPEPATAPAAATTSADEDPFAVKPKKASKAIRLQRKPTAKINHRVICPMCDTNGFGTPAVAGKEVRCPNPDCLMPVFVAPEIKKEAPPPPPKPIVTPVRVFALAAVLVMGGIAGYFYSQLPPAEPPAPEDDPLIVTPNVNQNVSPVATTTPDVPDTPPAPEPVDVAALEKTILEASIDAALQRNDNRSKPFCRQLNAEAFAAAGDIAGALKELDALDRLEANLNFLKITPLARIGWLHLENDNKTGAMKMADQAIEYSAQLPKAGAEAVRHAVALGTLLIALERHEEARSLMETREDVQDVTQSAARVAMVIEDGTFALSDSYDWLPRIRWTSPLTLATVYSATFRGYDVEATAFVNAILDAERKSEALAGLATGLAHRATQKGEAFSVDSIPEIAGLTEQDRNRALAQALQSLPEGPAASALGEGISTRIADWSAPAPYAIPAFREIYDGNFAFGTPESRAAAHTHLLLARYLASTGKKAEAWQQVESALAYTATLGATRVEADELVKDVERNRSSIQSRLATELNLTELIRQRSAFNRYRNNAGTISDRAQQRYELEALVYEVAIEWGLAEQYFQALQSGSSQSSNMPHLTEQSLADDLTHALKEAGNQEAVTAMQQKHPAASKISPALKNQIEIERLLAAGNVAGVRELMRQVPEENREPLIELRYACELARDESPNVVLEWNGNISSLTEQELAYRFSAILITRRGDVEEFWKESLRMNLSATEMCSRNLGLIEGLNSTDAYDVTPAVVPAPKPKATP